MAKYNALLAVDLSAYRNVEIEADSDAEALENLRLLLTGEGIDMHGEHVVFNPEYSDMMNHRIVDVGDDQGRHVAEELYLVPNHDDDNTIDMEIDLMRENEGAEE